MKYFKHGLNMVDEVRFSKRIKCIFSFEISSFLFDIILSFAHFFVNSSKYVEPHAQ